MVPPYGVGIPAAAAALWHAAALVIVTMFAAAAGHFVPAASPSLNAVGGLKTGSAASAAAQARSERKVQ
jgi:hypothetical protein